MLMDLLEEKILVNSMNSLTQQQWQELLLKIEEAFFIDPSAHFTRAQVQSKAHKKRKKFNQLKHEHGKSACLPFCKRISSIRQAEAKVFTIMCATHLSPLVFPPRPPPPSFCLSHIFSSMMNRCHSSSIYF